MKKYFLVSDYFGNDYVIPVEHRSTWYEFDFSDYDFDLPVWAKMIEGGLEFENPTEDEKELFESSSIETDLSTRQYSSALDMDWSENLNTTIKPNENIMELRKWYKYDSKVQSFHYNNEPELIHIIKTSLPNTYILVYEDAYQLDTGKTEILTKEQIEERFNVILTI